MPAKPESQQRSGGEILLDRLAAKLSQHALWDTLLLVVPPFGAALYALAMLFHAAALNSWAIAIIAIVAIAGTMIAAIFRYHRSVPSIFEVAQLADRQSGAKDHFLTLATLPSGNYPGSLLSRLRRESSAFGNRIEMKRDFPYKIKRSAYGSIGASLLAVLLIQLIAPVVRGGNRAVLESRLHQLAEKLGAKPELKSLASQLETLAAKLEDPKASVEEKQQLAQQLEQQIEEQQKREESEENRNLLGQAAGALEGVEQQVASAQSPNERQKGGGGIQSNLPQKGEGESKESQGTGAGKGDSKTQPKSDLQQGNAGTPKPNERTQENSPQQGATADRNQTDPNQANKDLDKEQAGKTQGGSKEGAGKQQASEQPPPQGVHPADRLYPSGEGKQGLQGTGYVTVQLPEEIAADGKFESRPSKDAKNGRSRSQIPLSNVPLPAHVPNAASEKQELPIEYRGLIR